MNGRQVGYVFSFFAVAITIAAGTKGYVSFSGTTVTLYCTLHEYDDSPSYKWYHDKTEQPNKTESSLILENYTDKENGLYSCTYEGKTHYFYIHAKVCEGCYDMNMILAFGIIFGDVLFTLGIVLLIYFCCKNKEAAAAPQRAAKQRQARGPGRGPPVPEADYQPLNPATRSNDIYAQAHR